MHATVVMLQERKLGLHRVLDRVHLVAHPIAALGELRMIRSRSGETAMSPYGPRQCVKAVEDELILEAELARLVRDAEDDDRAGPSTFRSTSGYMKPA